MSSASSESKDSKTENEGQDSIKPWEGANLGSALVSYSPSPSHVMNGMKKGLQTFSLSTLGGIALFIALPIKAAYDGHSQGGIVGGAIGSVLGLVGGTLAGAGLVTAGAINLVYQSMYGLARTPSAIFHSLQGMEWDPDAEEWGYYDLQAESAKLGCMSEEHFVHLMETTPPTTIFSMTKETAQPGEAPRVPRKNVADRELYDVLGVEPEASAGEIKRAYYAKAREFHPDRNPGPQAKTMFQRIGQAYQVLGDDRTRSDYDNRGKEVVNGANQMDMAMIYLTLFGSENFEPLIGELQVSILIRYIFDPKQKPSIVMRFRQRKRELQCAMNLAATLDAFVQGDTAVFRERALRDREDLSENFMGRLLLRHVGSLYMERAKNYIASIDRMQNWMFKPVRVLSNILSYTVSGAQAASSALELHQIHADAEKERKKAAEEAKQQGLPPPPKENGNGLHVLYKPNASEQEKKDVRKRVKAFTKHLLRIVWHFTKMDVRATLKQVCKKVLTDHSVSAQTRHLRAQGLVVLGEIFTDFSVEDEDEGLTLLLDKLAHQMGFEQDESATFAARDASSESSVSDDEEEEKEGDKGEKHMEHMRDLRDRLLSLSVKELKRELYDLGCDCSGMLEKGELQEALRSRVEAALSSGTPI